MSNSRYGEIRDQVAARLKGGALLEDVISAANPKGVSSGSSLYAVVSVQGTTSARDASWAVHEYDGAAFPVNDWLYVLVEIRCGTPGAAPDPTEIELARDYVRARLVGYEPAPLTVDKCMEPMDPDGEAPSEAGPELGIGIVFRMGVFSQEGTP